MATRLTGYIFVVAAPLTKGGGLDEIDGNNWNSLVAHTTRVVTCANETVAMLLTDYIFECDTSAGSVTIQLTAAGSSTGKEIWVHKTSASNTVTLDPDGGELINGAGTLAFTDNNGWVHAYCNGTGWRAEQPGAGGGGTDEKVEVQEAGVMVGSASRKLNFSNASNFTVTEDAGNNRIDVSLNFGTGANQPAEGNHVQALANIANSGGAVGDIMYWNGSNWIRLAVGANGTVLKLAGGLPTWGTDLTSGGTGQWSIVSRTSGSATPYSASWGDGVVWSTGSGDKEVDLPTAVGNSGLRIWIKKSDNGTGIITIDPSGTQTIDGGGAGDPIYLNGFNESVVLTSDGTNILVESWFV